MTDIVETLRDGCDCGSAKAECPAKEACQDAFDAADQIERLRQQVGMLEMSNAMSEATISDMGKKIEHLRRIVINLLDDGDETDCAEARAALGEGK